MSPSLGRYRKDLVTFTQCRIELHCREGTQRLVARSPSAKKLIRKIPHTIAVIPCALVVLGMLSLSGLSLPRLSACANRE